MEGGEGWIIPQVRKRPRLSDSETSSGTTNTEDAECILDDDNEDSLGSGSKSASDEISSKTDANKGQKGLNSAPPSPSGTLMRSRSSTPVNSRRQKCEYGLKCYRRNVNHLTEFIHPFLEKVYAVMQKGGYFLEIPPELEAELTRLGGDNRVLLEQIRILKNTSFTPYEERSESEDEDKTFLRPATFESPSASPKRSKISDVPKTSPGNGSGSSDPDWKESLKDVRYEHRKKYLENQTKKTGLTQPETKSNGEKRTMLDKWEASCPFNFFVTKVTAIPSKKDVALSASFFELFDPSLGEVKSLCHFNFMIDPEWFIEQTMRAGIQEKPTRVIFDGDGKDLAGVTEAFPWLKIYGVKSQFMYGHHHTKMSIVQYTDGSIRFIIYTANLIESDWDNRTQGIWIGPRCPKLGVEQKPSVNAGDSATKFKSDMIQYLATYPVQATAAWIDAIKEVDCSAIKVYLVASAPTTAQSTTSGFQWGSMKMEKILRSINSETEPNWPLIIQCSSIGTLGQGPQDWLKGELGIAFTGKDKRIVGPIHVVYPSHNNVKESFDGLKGGGCLPYSSATHIKQNWLEKHFCQWKANRSGRSRAVPHIKSYLRVSPDSSKIAWVLLTSANLSKAAWGKLSKKGDRLSVMSWEAGVLFMPQTLCDQDMFAVQDGIPSQSKVFPIHIDLPVVPYQKDDKPWLFDTLQALIMNSPTALLPK